MGNDRSTYDAERILRQRSQYRQERDSAAAEAQSIRAESDRLRAENAVLKPIADANPWARKAQELEAQVREIEHRRVFDRIALSKGVAADAIDLLFQGLKYSTDQPVPDEVAIGAMLDQAKGSPGLSMLFGDPTASGQPSNATTPMPPPAWSPTPPSWSPSAGQNYRTPMAPNDERHGDVRYVWENFDTISQAARERIERGEG